MKKIAVFIFIVFIFLISIALISIRLSKQQKNTPLIVPSPTIFPEKLRKSTNTSNPPVADTKGSDEKLIQKVKNRITLSQTDLDTKKKVVFSLGGKSGILYSSPSFTVEYLKSPDIFQVEILNENIQQSKQQATTWFKSQGFTQEGICNLPVMFYINWDTANKLRGSNTEFNPLAEGC